MAKAIFILGMLVFFGHLLAAVFRRTRVPDVLILMVVGFLLGPHVLGWVKPDDLGKAGPVFTTVALLVILFESGVNLPFGTLRRSLVPTALITMPTALITIAIGATIARPVFADGRTALMLGVIVSAVSSAVVIPLLQGLKVGEKIRTVLTLESVITDVVAVVCTFALLRAIETDRFHIGVLFMELAYSMLIAVGIGVAGGVVWRVLLTQVRRFPNTLFTEFAFVFVLYGLAEFVHANGPVAVLVFGITALNLSSGLLARVPVLRRFQLAHLTPVQFDIFAEAVFLAKVFFFVYLGMTLTVSEPHVLAVSGLIVAATYAARLVICRFLLTRDATRREAGIAAVLVPKGLTAAVLASIPAQAGVPGGQMIQEIVFAVVFFSMVLTSVLIPLLELKPGRRLLGSVFRPFRADTAHPPAEHAMQGRRT